MYIIFALVPLLLLYISAWIGSWFLWDCVNFCSIVQEIGKGGRGFANCCGKRVIGCEDDGLSYAAGRASHALDMNVTKNLIAFLTHSIKTIKIRNHHRITKASENPVAVSYAVFFYREVR